MLREYLWNGLTPVAVIENGAVYFVRVDHIGRPVFATDAAGAVVWTVRYDPFGGVTTQTGLGTPIRFPGQWFQSESGLHQNWMRDYDPTTGRYLQPDPLGLVDGAGVYGYALQNPGRWVDPRGECIGPLVLLAPACAGAVAGAATFLLYEYVWGDGCWTWAELAAATVSGAAFGMIGGPFAGLAGGLGRGATGGLAAKGITSKLGGASDDLANKVGSSANWALGKHKSAQKWENQMKKRNWTKDQIDEAIRSGSSSPAPNNINPGNGATRYVNPQTGRSVVVDDTTRETIQVGGDGFKF